MLVLTSVAAVCDKQEVQVHESAHLSTVSSYQVFSGTSFQV